MKRFAFLFVLGVLLLPFLQLVAQPLGHYHTEIAGAGTIQIPSVTGFSSMQVNGGKVMVKADFGDDYNLGKDPSLSVDVQFTLTLNNGAYTNTLTLTLKADQPEKVLVVDLAGYIDHTNSTYGLTFNSIQLVNVTTSGSSYALSSVRTTLSLDIDYGLNVAGMIPSSLSVTGISGAARARHFTWSENPTSLPVPDHEIQIMKLYNESNSTISNDNNITISNLDWTRALSFETQSKDLFIDLSLGEGNGWYVWRIRPIGTFYEGGIANNKNWGSWSTVFTVNTTANINSTFATAKPELFYFDDPDINLNYIYSRTFTEGKNNQMQKISYANSLLQLKQTQIYLPATLSTDRTTIVNETFSDHLGRPAINMLPVPDATTPDGLNGYKPDFTKNVNGTPYSKNDFDYAASSSNPSFTPSEVKTASGPYEYYSNSNADDRIPDANGYPMSSVRYDADGSNIAIEKSGVGKVHMIGDQNNGMGRTVKTLQGSASQTELDLLFGHDEAPLSENVFKTVTIDENNIASVTFTNKEGKVIATGLANDDVYSTNDILDPVENGAQIDEPSAFVHLTNNVTYGDGFISTRRILLMNNNGGSQLPVNMEYKIDCDQLKSLCGDVLDNVCNFDLTVFIYSINDLSTPVYTSATNPVNCNTAGTQNPLTFSTTLDPGEYLVEKILRRNSIPNGVSVALDNAQLQLAEITRFATERLAEVDCDQELMVFYNDLYDYITRFHPASGNYSDLYSQFSNSNYTISLPSGVNYSFNPVFAQFYVDRFNNMGSGAMPFDIVLYDSLNHVLDPYTIHAPDVLPHYMVVTTPCCETVRISLAYQPPFKCPTAQELLDFKHEILTHQKGVSGGNFSWANFETNEDFFHSTNNNTLIPDFEGYGVSLIAECTGDVDQAREMLYKHMAGWNKKGMFNAMVFHMLTDVYSVDGYGTGSCNAPANSCGTAPVPASSAGSGYQMDCNSGADDQVYCSAYKCSDLANCWKGLVRLIISSECENDATSINLGSSGGVSNGVDEQNSGDGSVHNDQFDDNFDVGIPWPFGWFMDMLVSARMRNHQNVGGSNGGSQQQSLDLNIVEQFLECTGYQFADILNPSSCTAGAPAQPSQEQTAAYYTANPGVAVPPCFLPLDDDFDAISENGKYGERWYDQLAAVNSTPSWNDFNSWNQVPESGTYSEKLEKVFANIHDPIYAFKYFEYQYGSQQDIELSTCFRDPNMCWDGAGFTPCCGTDNGGHAIPCNFCGIGYMTCPTTKVNWNSGQRYTFFSMLKNTEKPDDYESETTQSLPTPCGVVRPSPITMDCSWYNQNDTWYNNAPPSNQVQRLPNVSMLTSGQYNDVYCQLPSPSLKLDINGNTSITPAEYLAFKMNKKCSDDCGSQERRDYYKSKLIQMFTDRCYVIGGCKASPEDNVVPEEDLAAMVDALVAQCESQCNIQSIYCDETYCRDINTPMTVYSTTGNANGYPVGLCPPTNPFNNTTISIPIGYPMGMTNITVEKKFGVAGCTPSDPNCNFPSNTNFTFYHGGRPAYPLDFPYGEYTLYLQAKDWDVELDIESRCNSAGVYDASYTGTDHYVFVGGQWVLQNMDCSNYSDQTTPTGTVMNRDDYVQPTGIIDPNHPIGQPVLSPSVGIQVVTPH